MADQKGENRTRLVLFSEQGLFRASLARLLAEAGFEVAGECGGAAEALEVLASSPVDLILLDFDPRPREASQFISAAREVDYRGGFLIIAGTMDAERSAMALSLGVSGIFLKSEPPERLIQAIRMIVAGALWIDPRIIRVMADQCLHAPRRQDPKSEVLDERQRRVILGILGGLSNRKIADGMGLSESLIKNILQSLFRRTGVRTRSQLVGLALEGSLGNLGRNLARPEAGNTMAGVGGPEPASVAEGSAPSDNPALS